MLIGNATKILLPKCNKYTLQWQKQKPLECFASFALAFRQEIRQLNPQDSSSSTMPPFCDRKNSWAARWTRGFPQNSYPTNGFLNWPHSFFFPSVTAANSFQLSKITHWPRISPQERTYECSWKATWPSVFLQPQSGDCSKREEFQLLWSGSLGYWGDGLCKMWFFFRIYFCSSGI